MKGAAAGGGAQAGKKRVGAGRGRGKGAGRGCSGWADIKGRVERSSERRAGRAGGRAWAVRIKLQVGSADAGAGALRDPELNDDGVRVGAFGEGGREGGC